MVLSFRFRLVDVVGEAEAAVLRAVAALAADPLRAFFFFLFLFDSVR